MKRYIIFILSILAMTMVFSVNAQNTNTKNIKSSFTTPDFNYPQTVITDSEVALKTALSIGNGEDVVMAVIQNSIAKSMISSDSLPEIIEEIESIAMKESNECIKSTLFLLEAHILNSYYNRNQYKISSRNNLNSPISSNIFEWDSKQFKLKISRLLDNALSHENTLKSTPITTYSKFVKINNVSISTYPTMYDFIAYKSIEIYKGWGITSSWNPFIRTSSLQENDYSMKVLNIYNKLLSIHNEGSRPYINAKLGELKFSENDTKQILDSLYTKYKENPNVAPILMDLAQKMEDSKIKYQLYQSYLKKFPTNDYTALIQLRSINLETPSEKLSFKSQYTSTDTIRMQCRVENSNKITVAIYQTESNDVYIRNNTFLKSSPIFKKEYNIEGTIPFLQNMDINIPPLPYGRYIAVAYSDYEQLKTTKSYNTFIVSDIFSFGINDSSNETRRIFTTKATTGQPYKGVAVTAILRNKNTPQFSKTSNGSGYVSVNSSDYYNFNFLKGKDRYNSASYYSNYYDNENKNKYSSQAQIFTDLAIYRPGETIHFSAVCYRVNTEKKELIQNKSLSVIFCDANSDTITSTDIITDEMGRISHDFIIPTNRMNGNYIIHIKDKENNDYLGGNIVTVSEYKTPSFYIDFIDKKSTYSDSGIITLKGIVKTFSDMPIADTSVECTLERGSFWYLDFNKWVTLSTRTDEMGIFTITFNASDIKNKENQFFNHYRLTATATDKAGETQNGSMTFSLGSALTMRWKYSLSEPLSIIPDEMSTLPIEVISNEQNAQKHFNCILQLTDKTGKIVSTLPFSSDKPEFNFNNIKSGEYTLNAYLEQDTAINIKDKKIVIYRPTDKQCPVERALWTPNITQSCIPGKESSILLGNSFDKSHAYYVINYQNKILKEGWITLDSGFTTFKYTMPKNANSNLLIQFYCIKDLVQYSYNIKITPEINQPETILTTESFRDKITAGDIEKWTLHLETDGKPVVNGAIISTLTDKAVNTLRDNKWSFSPELRPLYTTTALSIQQNYNRFNRFNFNPQYNEIRTKLNQSATISVPTLYLYGQNYFSSKANIRIRGTRAIGVVEEEATYDYGSDNRAVYALAKNSSVDNLESSIVTEYKSTAKRVANESEQEFSNIPVRTADIKTVFWKPMLVTNDNGTVNIEFNVPNINTTWQFQAVGYNRDLETATLLKEVISNKPIMVKSNIPRFLRQGDNTILIANVQNSTDTTQKITAVIEIFNPFSNQTYKSNKTTLELKGKETQIVSIDYSALDITNAIGFRIKATNGKFSDGEQVMIPILPSISPIIESKPFYIEQNITNADIMLPAFPEKAHVTFEYCNNPIWYVATALPSINGNDKTTSNQLAHSIFANIVAQKITKDNPNIERAIDYWQKNSQDSALISMLAKNQDLKIGTLLASPWMDAGKEQTLRMSQLCDLFNHEKSDKAINELVDKLAELQQQDGGFSWFKYNGAISSEYTTLNILQIIGKARQLNTIYQNDKLNEIIENGINFIDKAIINRYNKQKDKLNFSGYSNYAYTRSFFLDYPMSVTVKELYDKIIQSITKEWKKMNIVDKSFAIITLANFNKNIEAKPILESINQFSIYSPTTGRYWDNFQNGWYTFYNKVTLTSLVLQAYHRIEPQAKEIDQIRQWLLLEKQTTDWGNSSLAADAVYAILSSGTNWLKTTNQPLFLINGKTLELNPLDKILGYGKIQLDINNMSKNNSISIKRDNNTPAWGAVYCQYTAPMKSVKAASVSELSISKEIINYNNQSNEIKFGDKVQVRLIIKNSRNLEFVTVKDERAACFEPTSQISEYKYEDGIGYYLEIKDSKTNLFFNYLPKGTHVITYDAYVTNSGSFNCGIATVQCQYAPQITAHSAGSVISIK